MSCPINTLSRRYPHARCLLLPVQELSNQKIEGEPGNFSWLSQLRMYWEEEAGGDAENKTVMVRMMNAAVGVFFNSVHASAHVRSFVLLK